ncbi:MAG: ABC transporter substrate-binding protein, partial [Candidatus Phosphoribacter sp.]
VLTIRLKVPVPDFPQIVALPAFAPFRADRDRGGAGPHDVFSCGPYRLDGAWEVGAGGRFVRNPAWDRASDPLRQALPDVIDIREAIPVDTIIQRLSEDKAPDNTAVGLADLPGARLASLLADPAIAARLSNPSSGTVELLQPNLKSPTMSVPAIRQAFSLATDRTAFVAAYGPMAMSPTTAVLPASIASPAPPGAVSAQPSATMLPTETAQPSATAQPTATQALTLPGGPESAATVLAAAGVTLPVRVRVAYRSSPVADLAYAALVAGWERAGFEVVLDGLGEEYYDTVSAPQASERYDVFRTAWFADYPSGSAVIPALFDGRMNLTDQGTGQDLGSFNDEAVNAAIDAALVLADPGARAAAWNAIDAQIASLGGHVALAERRRVLLRGSGVAAYAENPFLGGWVDLAAISVR